MNNERRDTGFTDKSDRPIFEGDVLMWSNDYPGDDLEPDELHSDFGLVLWSGPKAGAEVDAGPFETNRDRSLWPMPVLFEEMGEPEIISSPGHPDYHQYVKETTS